MINCYKRSKKSSFAHGEESRETRLVGGESRVTDKEKRVTDEESRVTDEGSRVTSARLQLRR